MKNLCRYARAPAMNHTFRRSLAVCSSLLLLTLAAGCSGKKGSGQGAGSTGRNQVQPVYFAFDSQSIGSSENGKIQQIASFLQSGSSQVIIAGFTDERGTAEYNRGLGERRAESVREALIASGANAQNIQTVSFGAEMPADPASNEEAWAKNRRAEIGVVK